MHINFYTIEEVLQVPAYPYELPRLIEEYSSSILLYFTNNIGGNCCAQLLCDKKYLFVNVYGKSP